MNLDRSATHGLPRTGKGHAGLGPIGQHGRDGSVAGAAAGGGGGFLAVLATLDASDASGPMDAATALGSLQGGADLLTPAAVVEPELPDSTRLMPDAGWQVDTATLLAHLNRSAQWSPAAGGANDPLNSVPGMRPDGSGLSLPLTSEPATAAVSRGGAPRVPPQDQTTIALGDGASQLVAGSSVAIVDDVKAMRWDAAQLLSQHAEVNLAKSAVVASGFVQAASDTKARQAFVVPDVAVQAVAGPNATLLMAVPEGLTRKTDRVAGKLIESHTGTAGEGQWGPYALVSGRPIEAASAAQNGALPTPEMMVAEQVSYWISGKVQNAELRLDVFGREPVDVSISLQGSEAQVEFRTDQPEIRQVLEGAVAHLKDLLKDEGLSLAGVFVGSSGQQRQGAHPSAGQSGESGIRQARVEAPVVSASVLSSGQRPVSGRSVDLFV